MHTHTVGCSVFIRHAAEGCERTQQLRQITDKLNSSHSPAAIQKEENVAKWWHDWHSKQDFSITPKVTSINITIVRAEPTNTSIYVQYWGTLCHWLFLLMSLNQTFKQQQTYSSKRSLCFYQWKPTINELVTKSCIDNFLTASYSSLVQTVIFVHKKKIYWLLVESLTWKRFPETRKTTQNGGLVNCLMVGVH